MEDDNKKSLYKSSKLLLDNYENVKQIGKNKKIYEMKNKETGQIFICNKIQKPNIIDLKKFEQVINLLINSQHPNIIKVYNVYESKNSIYILMEKCLGGKLYDKILKHIEKKSMYSEKEAADILQQIMSAIEYFHNNSIYDKDLKPKNILYLNIASKKDNQIKIIDFGLTYIITPLKKLKVREIPNYYIAPEAIKGDFTEKCNIWNAGVILYILLSGEPPFVDCNDLTIYKKILQMKYEFPEEKWKNISDDAKDLISHMICEENERYTAKQVLEHHWFKKVNETP